METLPPPPEEEPPPESPPDLADERAAMAITVDLDVAVGSGGALAMTGLGGGEDAARDLAQALDVSDLDKPPTLIAAVPPSYPAELRRARVEGVVSLVFMLTEAGVVEDARVESSSRPEFERPALEAIRRWRFKAGHERWRSGEDLHATADPVPGGRLSVWHDGEPFAKQTNSSRSFVYLLCLAFAGTALAARAPKAPPVDDRPLAAIWNDPEFARRFFGYEASIEPKLSPEEQALYRSLDERRLFTENPRQAAAELGSKITPSSSALLDFSVASLHLSEGDVTNAVRHYEAAVARFPRFMRAHRQSRDGAGARGKLLSRRRRT